MPSYDLIVVDDDPRIREHLAQAIAQEPKLRLCASAENLEQGMELLKRHLPRVALVDLGLPDGNGLDLITAASLLNDVDTMVISVFGDEHHVISALKRGARGYILKDSLPATITGEILALIDGGSPISAKIARYLLKQFERPLASGNSAENATLTMRETEILRLIASGYRRHEIAEKSFISIDTVGTHISHIYRKLMVNSNIEAIRKGTDLGII